MKGPTFLMYPVHAHIFVQRFFESACSLGIQLIDCYMCSIVPAYTTYMCRTTGNKRVQNIKRAVYEWVNISDDLVYE